MTIHCQNYKWEVWIILEIFEFKISKNIGFINYQCAKSA